MSGILNLNASIYRSTTPFSPLDLTPDFWYDPSDLSTLWKDTAGTQAVTTDGDLVARVDDKSGNARNLTQATSSLRPLYKTDGTLKWLLFDGVDDIMSASWSLSSNTAHVYVATRYTGGASYARLISLSTTSAFVHDYDNSGRIALIIRNGTTDTFFGYRNNASVSSGITLTSGTDYVVDGKLDGTNYRIRSNGSTSASAASSANLSTDTMYVGRNIAETAAMAGRVYGIVGKSTAIDSASLVTWLGNKAGLSL